MPPAAAPRLAPDDPIEILIGEAVAVAALTLMAALQEFQNNGLTRTTRTAGGDAITALWELQRATRTEIPDFEQVAREHGTKALKSKCNGGYSAAAGDILIDETLRILARVTADAAALRLH